MSEATEQEALMQWAAVQTARYPELQLLHHIPNGGSRRPAEAAHLKAMGVKSGVPDLFLPVARGGKHGLYIEMKCGTGRLSSTQKKMITALTGQGYACAVCYAWLDAARVIVRYLEGEWNGDAV